jgi:hypothetical protein
VTKKKKIYQKDYDLHVEMVAVVVRVEAGADHGLGGVLLNVSIVSEGANETLGQSFEHFTTVNYDCSKMIRRALNTACETNYRKHRSVHILVTLAPQHSV